MSDKLRPKDHAERVALFRAQIIGRLAARELDRGDLRTELEALSRTPFRRPGGEITQCYSVSTLERWYYAFRARGLDRSQARPYGQGPRAKPHPGATRSDRGDREGARGHAGLGDRPRPAGRQDARPRRGLRQHGPSLPRITRPGCRRASPEGQGHSHAAAGRRRRPACCGTPMSVTAPRFASTAGRCR